jgi:heterodisulfide reductase subunit A-like polyferredoxin
MNSAGGKARGGGGHQRGAGQGIRRRQHDGSGRSTALCPGAAPMHLAVADAAAAPSVQVESRLANVTRPHAVAIVAHPDRCTQCKACLDACRRGAITLCDTAEVDAALCSGCGACEEACPNGVFELGGS